MEEDDRANDTPMLSICFIRSSLLTSNVIPSVVVEGLLEMGTAGASVNASACSESFSNQLIAPAVN